MSTQIQDYRVVRTRTLTWTAMAVVMTQKRHWGEWFFFFVVDDDDGNAQRVLIEIFISGQIRFCHKQQFASFFTIETAYWR